MVPPRHRCDRVILRISRDEEPSDLWEGTTHGSVRDRVGPGRANIRGDRVSIRVITKGVTKGVTKGAIKMMSEEGTVIGA